MQCVGCKIINFNLLYIYGSAFQIEPFNKNAAQIRIFDEPKEQVNTYFFFNFLNFRKLHDKRKKEKPYLLMQLKTRRSYRGVSNPDILNWSLRAWEK